MSGRTDDRTVLEAILSQTDFAECDYRELGVYSTLLFGSQVEDSNEEVTRIFAMMLADVMISLYSRIKIPQLRKSGFLGHYDLNENSNLVRLVHDLSLLRSADVS